MISWVVDSSGTAVTTANMRSFLLSWRAPVILVLGFVLVALQIIVEVFIELKGVTADRQMVDDTVTLVRAYDCVGDVALISLHYDVIDYAETTYPEFETGVLFFGAIGDLSKLNCDLLIMEEETATEDRIKKIHEAGKQAIVWTVNSADSMYRFLDSDVDAVITDQIRLAIETQKNLDDRTDLQVLQDHLLNFWD